MFSLNCIAHILRAKSLDTRLIIIRVKSFTLRPARYSRYSQVTSVP